MESLVNTDLGPFRLVEVIRRGGMATVFKAHQESLSRSVAVKVLDAHHDRQFVERFRAEAQTVARLQHPNILPIFEYGAQDGRLYLVTPYVEHGTSLADIGKPMPLGTALTLVTRLLAGLEYAHGRGVVHRDVKPSNVLLPAPDWPLLADFGIAKALEQAGKDLTAVGQVVGTAAYMAPEQATGGRVDARTDVYAVGVLLYELVTGQVPFGGGPQSVVLARHTSEPPPPPRGLNPAVPAALEQVILRALAKRPEDRYDSARAMAAELERVAATLGSSTGGATEMATQVALPSATRLPPWAPVGVALALLALLLVGAIGAIPGRAGSISPAPSATVAATPAPAPSPAATAHPATPLPSTAPPAAGKAAQAAGRVIWRDHALRNDAVAVIVEGLPPPEAGNVYAAWLSGAAGDLALGPLTPREDGRLAVTYRSPQHRNLLAGYDRAVIGEVPEEAAQMAPHHVLLSGALPEGALVHLRHVLVGFEETPDGAGLAVGLRREAELLGVHARLLREAYDAGDLAGERRHAEHLVAIIEGAGGEHVADLNGDGRVENPGNGFGLLPSARQAGYIDAAVTHALLAAESADATEEVRKSAASVETIGANVRGWTGEIRDRALSVARAGSPAETAADVAAIVELATYAHDGVDRNGNGDIEPAPGEGGALTAYWHAQLMADTWLLPAAR